MSTIPPELNWVEKRASCSAAQIFKELQFGIESDVVAANNANTISGPFMTTLTPDGCTFIVSLKNEVGPRIVFYCTQGRIEAKDEKRNIKISASLALSDVGRCVLRIENEGDLEQWQFRKRVLENFFFGD